MSGKTLKNSYCLVSSEELNQFGSGIPALCPRLTHPQNGRKKPLSIVL